MENEIKITTCYHICPFFTVESNQMYCDHPHWVGMGVYDNLIITQENSRDGKVPIECPLRKEKLVITYSLNIEQ